MYLPLVVGGGDLARRHVRLPLPAPGGAAAGGEYVYLSRIVSPAVGAMAGLGIAVVFTYVLSTNAHFAAQFTPFMLTASAWRSTARPSRTPGNHFGSNHRSRG